jgi:CMP-N-acetylneuraminic acid synthetase
MKKNNLVALLPMKAHSERVKGKNFRKLHSKPLFKWILDTLLSIEEIELVVINTDARHILNENGLNESDRLLIRDRKPELCGDFISMNLILKDDIENIPSHTYLMTHTTNPLLSAGTIRSALKEYQAKKESGKADSLFTVNKFQTRFYRADGSPVNHDPNNLVRTQDLEPWFEENSNLFIFTAESFQSTNARIGKKPILFPMSKKEAVDIDDASDWELAEIIIKAQNP